MSEMLERILSNENIERAYKKVYANKGAGGVDGVTTKELAEYMRGNWDSTSCLAIYLNKRLFAQTTQPTSQEEKLA